MDKLPVCYGQGIAPYCPICRSGEYLYNEDGNKNNYCGQCGCALDWAQMYNEDTEQIEEKFKCGDCKWYCRSVEKESEGVCKVKGVSVRRSKPVCKKYFKKAVHIWSLKESEV